MRPWSEQIRGTKAKIVTSCDNAFVTNLLLLTLRLRAKNICCPKRLIGRPQEALLCAKAKRQRQMFSVAKANRQLQSTQSERKSTPRLEKGLYFLICHLDFIDIIVFQQHENLLV